MNHKVNYTRWLEREKSRLTLKNEKIKAERDTLIDDLSWYKAKVSRLERENEKLAKHKSNLESSYQTLSNQAIKIKSKLVTRTNLLTEFSQHIGCKPSISKYKYFREKLDTIDWNRG